MDLFRERLIDLRIEHGYTQEDIAKNLNVTKSAYGYYEQGRNEPSIETLHKIASFYQVSTDYLLGKIDTPQHPVYYALPGDINLTKPELDVIKKMKEFFLLQEVSEDPSNNMERLYRLWDFIKRELKLKEKI